MRSRLIGIGVGVLTFGMIVASVGAEVPGSLDLGKPPFGFTGGKASREELVQAYLDAIYAQDAAALHALRVTKDEYQQIIVPGTVDRGQPPRKISDTVQKYFWEQLDYKSVLYQELLFKRFANQQIRDYEIVYTEEAREYDWFRAWGELRVDYENNLRTAVPSGWIAEVDGKYKFLGFEWDY